jgi:hypothetical protein
MHGGLDHLQHFILHHGRGISNRTESKDNDIPQDGLIQIDDMYWSCELLDEVASTSRRPRRLLGATSDNGMQQHKSKNH